MPLPASFTNATASTTTTSTTPIAPSSSAKFTISSRSLPSGAALSHRHDENNTDSAPRMRSKQNMRSEMSHAPSTSSPLITSIPAGTKNPHSAKLQKRGQSQTSLPTSPSQYSTAPHTPFSTPFATFEEPGANVAPSPLASGVPKIKPYLRKMSSAREDQGMIDLSKSTKDNERLAGLGIQDFAPKSVADVTFAHNRRGHHTRTTSVGSQLSTGSGGPRPSQPFIHPMAKTPRPYTPPSGSYAPTFNVDDEANESDDVVEDEFRLASGFRSKRSTSVSSNNPTPLSQAHTAVELAPLPTPLTTSQSNLSLATSHSDMSTHRKSRPRRNTDLSQEYLPTPSSRTSSDKGFSLPGRKSEPAEPQSRDEIILAARRKFEEKEANKDRKYERRRRESDARKQRKMSDAASSIPVSLVQPASKQVEKKKRRKSSAVAAEDERSRADGFRAVSYEDHRPAHSASLPRYGNAPGGGEKSHKLEYTQRPVRNERRDGGWMRFSTWFQTRMLSCGGSRK